MFTDWFRKIDRVNALVAAGVGLAVFVTYLLTQAVTLTFWDCGEFIACCHILGIPHPPGTPLYVIIGRLFAILPLFTDAAARINFLSVLSSTLTAIFAYLCAVRALRLALPDQSSPLKRALIYAGAASGALFLAFSKTQWGNAGEAEVYGLSMLIFFIMLWLTFRYSQRPASESGDSLMLTVVYLAFLGIGVHMTTFLALPVCALFFILKRDTPARIWMIVGGALLFELYLIFALSSRPGEVPHYVPILIVFVIYLLYLFSLDKGSKFTLWFVIAYLPAIAPVFAKVAAVVRNSPDTTASPVLFGISIAGAVALAGLAVYALTVARSAKGKSTGDYQTLIVSALLVGIAAIAVIIPLIQIRGYKAFLFVSALLLLTLGATLSKYIRWPILIAVVCASAVMMGVFPFIYALGIAAIIAIVMMSLSKNREWRTALLILLVAVTGYSIHLFLPIRSSQKPMLDHSSLSDGFTVTADFLDRKQYTSQSMMERMFVRRAEWRNQFGDYERMGFWRFFSDQYGINGPRFMALFLLGVLGLWEIVRRAPQVGLALTLLAIIGSIGLVLYMNFSDGTRQNPVTGADYIEVRDRDYFFTPAFLIFGLAIGLGVASLIGFIQEAFTKASANFRQVLTACASLLFLLPVYALAGNYWESDRSRNYVAYDYAANILDSADRDAVLFTYGDNDTFPLWCLQEAFGFRKDVRIVNLSLAGSRWYVKQVRDYLGVNIGMSDNQIEQLRAYQTADGRYVGVSDQVLDAIIDNNTQRRPINFSTTVPPSHRHYRGASVDKRLVLSGLKWRLREESSGMAIAVDECYDRFTNRERFRVRGLVDNSLFKDVNSLRMVTSYSDAILITADSLRKANRLVEAEKIVQFALDSLPPDDQITMLIGTIYADKGDLERLTALQSTSQGDLRNWLSLQLARLRIRLGQKVEAEALMNQTLLLSPHYRPIFQELAQYYNRNLQYSNLRTLFEFWMKQNPDDNEVRSLAAELERVAKQRSLTDTVKK